MKKFLNSQIYRPIASFLIFLFCYALPNQSFAIGGEENWPNKPIRMIVGFAAGGGSDLVARLMAKELGDQLGVNVIVENRPGAGGNIATEAVSKASPDGYTILFITSAHSSSAAIKKTLSFKPVEDLTWISLVATYPLVILSSATGEFKSFEDFVSRAKAAPNKYTFSSSGVGTAMHLVGEWVMSEAGIQVTHVPFKGGSAPVTELVAGRVDVMVDTMPLSAGIIKDGRAKGLAATAPKNVVSSFNIPAVANYLPAVEFESWLGIAGPPNLPADIKSRLNKEINFIVNKPDVKKRLIDFGCKPYANSPEEFKSLVVNDIALFKKVITKANISEN
jgi:tripartite-type tricarboxylate transporter receptor subunit TctC